MSEIPQRLTRRPRDARGLVIAYVQYVAPDGTPDFRVLDDERVLRALRQRLCALCGDRMGRHIYFIGGPLCVDNGYFYDPPMHRECAVYAMTTCPHLARSKGRYAGTEQRAVTDRKLVVGEMDVTHKAEWFALMHTTSYEHSRNRGMNVFKAKLPWLNVQRWKDGSPMQ